MNNMKMTQYRIYASGLVFHEDEFADLDNDFDGAASDDFAEYTIPGCIAELIQCSYEGDEMVARAIRECRGWVKTLPGASSPQSGGAEVPTRVRLSQPRKSTIGNYVTTPGNIAALKDLNPYITNARVTSGMGSAVYATISGEEIKLFNFFDDEISFSPDEFIGLTVNQASTVYTKKDIAYLQS